MENQRLILFIALAFVCLLLWQQWQQDYGPVPVPLPTEAATEASRPVQDVPDSPAISTLTGDEPADAPVVAMDSRQRIQVSTDVFKIELDTQGGDLRHAGLPTYPVSLKQLDEPFVLLQDQPPELFIAQSGLLSDSAAPNHYASYTSAADSYTLADGEDTLDVTLTWQDPGGIRVDKTYTFHRGSFLVDVTDTVHNASPDPWTGRQYRQLQRSALGESDGPKFVYTYTGAVIYSDAEKYEKIDFDDMASADLSRDIKGGWAAMIQHYFLAAWLPDPLAEEHSYTKAPGGERYVIGLVSPSVSVPAGSSASFDTRLYVGPKLQDNLEKLAPGLELTVDYGWLTVLAKPLFWLLKWFHGIFDNWGWAIIFVTIVIKLVFFKLSEASYRSMARMRLIAPRLKSLKERYGDDKQKMQQAMMDIYRKEKINPLGGCLPILVQIPVFIALYWVLLETVELRQAPFMLWIQDMSAPDPYFILPLLMGATMLIQQRLNPAPMDPIQQKVMMALPVVFTVFFAFFPSGLVLYWVVNNTLSISQQWVITRRMEKGGK